MTLQEKDTINNEEKPGFWQRVFSAPADILSILGIVNALDNLAAKRRQNQESGTTQDNEREI